MHRHLTAMAVAAAALLALTACGSSDSGGKPDVAACKTAMQKQFDDGMKTGATGSRPAECEGVDDKTLQKLAAEIMEKALGATPTP